MRKNRTSTHRGKSGSAKHNTHEFMEEQREVSGANFCGNDADLEGSELEFYEERYTPMLQMQNAKYIERRQYKRCKTIEDIYASKRYRPTEEIDQYGYVGGRVPDRETYNKMMEDFISWKREWSEKNGNHLHVLNYTNHFDESTPHTHSREIWDYTENGVVMIGQEKAMELAGLELPDPSKPVGRYNNRGMTYTAMCREKWQDICEQYGYEVEREPLPVKKKSETVDEYQSRVNREYFEAREKDLKKREDKVTLRERRADRKEKELDDRERRIAEKEEVINRQYKVAVAAENEERSVSSRGRDAEELFGHIPTV